MNAATYVNLFDDVKTMYFIFVDVKVSREYSINMIITRGDRYRVYGIMNYV